MADTLKDLIDRRFADNQRIGENRTPTEIQKLLLGHRSHRRYEAKPIDNDTMQTLFACALSAPAKSDLQQVAIIRFTDPDKRNAVTDLLPGMPWTKEAPEFLLFCGDGRRVREICALRGTAFGHHPLDAFMNAAADAAIVMQTFIVAAEAEGLGCCPISGVREVTDDIVAIANLPEAVFPFAGLCVGYPADDPWISARLPMGLTVHENEYDDSGLKAALDDYDRRRAAVNPYRRQRDVETYGQDPAYGWSTDKSRQTAKTERTSFCRYVTENGYPIE